MLDNVLYVVANRAMKSLLRVYIAVVSKAPGSSVVGDWTRIKVTNCSRLSKCQDLQLQVASQQDHQLYSFVRVTNYKYQACSMAELTNS